MIEQTSLFSDFDTDPSAKTEVHQLGDFSLLLTYLDRNIQYQDDGQFWGTQVNHYSYRGGYVWRLVAPSGVVAEMKLPEHDREVAIATAKMNAEIYGKKLGLKAE